MLLELLGHADAVILHLQEHAHIPFALGRRRFVQGNLNGAALRGKLNGVGQQVNQNLVQAHAVAQHVFRGDIVNESRQTFAAWP